MNNAYSWYSQLIKPTWAPPSWIFSPVWAVLYILIAISFSKVFIMAINKKIPAIISLPFILNLIFNFSFTYFQFGLRNNYLAMADILLVLITLVWSIFVIYSHAKWVSFINIPYLLWVCFATVLQITVTFLNK